MKRKHKPLVGVTYKQKQLILNSLSVANMLHNQYCMHNDWEVDMDCDWQKYVRKTSQDLTRAYKIFELKTKHIRKPKRRKRK